jgi:hypothetical protein
MYLPVGGWTGFAPLTDAFASLGAGAIFAAAAVVGAIGFRPLVVKALDRLEGPTPGGEPNQPNRRSRFDRQQQAAWMRLRGHVALRPSGSRATAGPSRWPHFGQLRCALPHWLAPSAELAAALTTQHRDDEA